MLQINEMHCVKVYKAISNSLENHKIICIVLLIYIIKLQMSSVYV